MAPGEGARTPKSTSPEQTTDADLQLLQDAGFEVMEERRPPRLVGRFFVTLRDLPVDEMFSFIEPIPLGSASLAQTHRAWLITGEEVFLKVLKPSVRRTVEADTKLLRMFGRILQIFLARYQPARLIDEFCRYTLREVNLHFEADNAETFAAKFQDEQDVLFPRIYRAFSSSNVLCMEYFRGQKADASAIERLTPQERRKAIDLGVGATVRMIFRDGFFHADLHPANLIIFDDGRVGFIDPGMVGRFDSDLQKRMFSYFYSLVMGDAATAAAYLTAMSYAGRRSNPDGFRRAVEDLNRRNPFFAQVWYPNHDRDESNLYPEEACHDIAGADRDQ